MVKTAKMLREKRLGGWQFNLFGGNRIKNKSYLIDAPKEKAIKIMRRKGYVVKKV